MRKNPLFQMLAIGVIAIAIGIPIALVIPWYPTAASKQAHNFKTIYDVLLIVSVPILVLVYTVIVFCVWKFRMRPGEEQKDGPPIHGNTRLEVIWTALPALMLVSLATFAYTTLRSNEASAKDEMTINVTERQFAFEFSYPQPNGKAVASAQLYLAKGQPIVFKLRSLDVIHSFFVPEFSEKLDAVPGITTTLRVTPTRTGSFPVECTELCGAGHSLMRTTVHVLTRSAFATWLRSQSSSAPPPIGSPPPLAAQPGVPGAGAAGAGSSSGGGSSGKGASTGASSTGTSSTGASGTSAATSAAAGKAVFIGSAGCGQCHTLAAAGTTASVGPDLGTSVTSDAKKRGLPLKAFILESITKPNAFLAPGFAANIMPQTFSQTVTSAQSQALVSLIAGVTK
ncbi:MAG: cytochrome c oxidase subunit II [Solirubrobacteraceae bacterium]